MLNKVSKTCADLSKNMERAIEILDLAGLRATAPRVLLTCLLFCDENDCHVTADALYEKAKAAGAKVSLATIYNTLRLFSSVGIIRQVAVNSGQVYFDADTSEHQHFYNEKTGELINIKENLLAGINFPPLPEGARLLSVDLMIRIVPADIDEVTAKVTNHASVFIGKEKI